MTEAPLISVVILNYRRLKELERCLDSAVGQRWPNTEIIVVDNHSEENVEAVIAAKGDAIRLVALQSNAGACGGRNVGIREARGDIIVTIDNDVTFASPLELHRVAAAFAAHPEAQVLAFKICDADTGKLRIREWCHWRDYQDYEDREFETIFFGEGASAFRREVFDRCGLYWEPLFIGNEGYDMALRILDHGFRILYCPAISVFHSMASETRTQARPFYFYTRNYIWIAYKDHCAGKAIRYLVPKVLMMFLFSVRAGQWKPFVRGLLDGTKGLGRIARTQVQGRTSAYISELAQHRPSLFQRVKRHYLQTQL